MRAMMLTGLFLALGGITVSDVAIAQEPKKEEKKKKPKLDDKASYTDPVTVRTKTSTGFGTGAKTVAVMWEIEGKPVVYLWIGMSAVKPLKGSEITDKNGAVFVIDKATRVSPFWDCKVTKKPVEKKPE